VLQQEEKVRTLSWLMALATASSFTEILTFDSFTIGKTPPGWSVSMTHTGGPPKWAVVKDTTAPSQPYVLAQLSTDRTEGRCPLAIFDKLSMQDGEVSVKFKPVSGSEERAAGIVWRYRDENNYYVARANALGHNVAVFRVENGRHIPLGRRGSTGEDGVSHEVTPRRWGILKVAIRGPVFSVYYDHRRILQVEDSAFGSAGKVGLWTKADSVVYFDNFRIVRRQ
jgi:hypothetical protein